MLDSPTEHNDLPPSLDPSPPAEDPLGGTFPRALSHRLQFSPAYTCGRVFLSEWSSRDKCALRDRLLSTRMPPNSTPGPPINGVLSIEPIPGMIRLIPGVPFVQLVDGEMTTVACLHTTESLCRHRDVGGQVSSLTKTLCDLTFGVVKEGKVTVEPVYTLPGLKRNDRSPKTSTGSMNGSFNLASTVLKGDGRGCFLPAVQTSTEAAQERINAITTTLHKLGRIVLRHSVSRFEWGLFGFICTVNNVVGFGGFEPNGTGLQMNVSSGFTSLADIIGQHQGGFHSDQSDEHMLWTVLTLLFRLPRGAALLFLLLQAD